MLHFTQTESTFSYFEATRAYIERRGKPKSHIAATYTITIGSPSGRGR